MLKRELLGDEAQRPATLGEHACWNLDNSTTGHFTFPLSGLWLRHALVQRPGSLITRENDDEG